MGRNVFRSFDQVTVCQAYLQVFWLEIGKFECILYRYHSISHSKTKDTDQTVSMYRLVYNFAAHKQQNTFSYAMIWSNDKCSL